MIKVYCIMPCYLGDYPNSASNKQEKFMRAVNSFLRNDYEEKKLIIVSDGCDKTKKLVFSCFQNNRSVKIIHIKKQLQFSGAVRQAGIEYVNNVGEKTDIITYLDSDDKFQSTHITNIVRYFGNNDWVYFNDYLYKGGEKTELRQASLKHRFIGTSNIAHLNKPAFNWKNCDGYGHDWLFIQKLMEKSNNYKQIRGCGYLVCHTTAGLDF